MKVYVTSLENIRNMEPVRCHFNILVVDDIISARKIIIHFLSKLGFSKFAEADDGTTALNLLEQEAFQLVVSDWDMPKMDGITLMNHMRKNEQLKDIPFVLVTSNADKEDVVKAAKLGISDYLVKPFSQKALQQIMDKLIPDICI